MRIAANVLSWIFHPLLLTTWLVLFLGYYFQPIFGIDPRQLLWFAFFVFLVTFIFPALNILLMIRMVNQGPVTMPQRKQRIAPFILISLIYCFFAGLFMYRDILGNNFIRLVQIIAALVVIGTLITFFFKISIHTLAMAGCAGILFGLNRLSGDGMFFYPLIGVVALTGLIMSSRLFLNAHTPREVSYGALVGFVTGLTGMVLLF